MKDQLNRLEQQLQAIVEGSLSRLLGGDLAPATVATQLATAMVDGLKWDAEGKAYAPDQFAMTMHPKDVEALILQAPDLRKELGEGLLEVARSHGFVLSAEPNITLAADPTLSRWQVRVIAWHSENPLEFTQGMPSAATSEEVETPPPGAFLIIDGRKHFPLDRTVINIGRRLDNQLILDDPHVSRTHAQLRVREGRYVVFDLGSTGGTLVNGRRVSQHALRPGDVITIADTPMVYGEDPGGPPDQTPAYTPPFPPKPAGDQLTRTWRDNKEIKGR
jgi:hypothetical protein